MKQNYLHAYAVLRYETERDPLVPIDLRITVKKVVFDPNYADSEVKRLNALNQEKGAYYFSQITRIEQPDVAAAPVSPDIAHREMSVVSSRSREGPSGTE